MRERLRQRPITQQMEHFQQLHRFRDGGCFAHRQDFLPQQRWRFRMLPQVGDLNSKQLFT
ncbi:hypothetical protein [Xenorhabdus bovienii]